MHSYRVIGPLNIEILKECLRYLSDRHEILRTTFGSVASCPVQIIHKSAPLDFPFVDLIDSDDPEGQADSIIRKEFSREIDLEKLPIKRNVLIRVADNNYRLLRISHPLISDGFASQILDAELATLYEAMLQGREPPLSKGHPYNMPTTLSGSAKSCGLMVPISRKLRAGGRVFRRTATSSTAVQEVDTPRPLDPSEGVLRWEIKEQASKRLDVIARSAGATHFTVRLAAFAALIGDVTAIRPSSLERVLQIAIRLRRRTSSVHC